jgi:hypothetical protein
MAKKLAFRKILLVEQRKEIRKTVTQSAAKNGKKANSPDLNNGFEQHLVQTRYQVE